MTQKDKKELIIALCGYLPYNLICYNENYDRNETLGTVSTDGEFMILSGEFDGNSSFVDDFNYKPYLRSLSSMTDKEKVIISNIHWNAFDCHWNMIDFLNKHHFDYRDLIKRGLALEAPENMYENDRI